MNNLRGHCSCTYAPCPHDLGADEEAAGGFPGVTGGLLAGSKRVFDEINALAPLPLLIGESNPYGPAAEYALYPDPPGCTGWRLCRMIMQLKEETYLDAFERVNLLSGAKWSAPAARTRARELEALISPACSFILLGRKVCDAFDIELPAPSLHIGSDGREYLCLPHPSGLNRLWTNEPALAGRCRQLLRQHVPGVPFGEIAE